MPPGRTGVQDKTTCGGGRFGVDAAVREFLFSWPTKRLSPTDYATRFEN
jgi:hypothetical protein